MKIPMQSDNRQRRRRQMPEFHHHRHPLPPNIQQNKSALSCRWM
jgi:hypothetical protein